MLIQLGVAARNVSFISHSFATTLHGIGVFVGLIMWGYAILWIVFAVVTIASRFPRITFSMAWWGFTFPLGMQPFCFSDSGTFSLCSSQLGKELSLTFFNVIATIVTVCVILLWVLVAVRTAIEGWKGEIFYAPCLASVGDKIPETIDMTVEPGSTNTTNQLEVR